MKMSCNQAIRIYLLKSKNYMYSRFTLSWSSSTYLGSGISGMPVHQNCNTELYHDVNKHLNISTMTEQTRVYYEIIIDQVKLVRSKGNVVHDVYVYLLHYKG